jgi:hypothetical protein
MHDLKNIFFACLFTFPCYTTAMETKTPESITSVFLIPFLLMLFSKLADLAFKLYLIRRRNERDEKHPE